MKLKHCIAIIGLTIGGCVAMYFDYRELAGVCFGAIASWGLINGVQKATEEAS